MSKPATKGEAYRVHDRIVNEFSQAIAYGKCTPEVRKGFNERMLAAEADILAFEDGVR